ncbi:hypothetical protein [Natronococcus roseus]|uniref:hypothetical protein n=1 Tax=Natronococcus roseus TaxID=1052014 RepID=UPI00374D54F3
MAGIATASLYITGISIPTGFAVVVAMGVFGIVVRPRMYGYIMSGIGVVSVLLSVVLFAWNWSFLTVGAVATVGVGAVLRGVHTQLNMQPEQ